jgi:hypothetical protein
MPIAPQTRIDRSHVRVTSRSRPFTGADAHYPPTWGIDGTITARCAEFSVGAEIYAFGRYGLQVI